MQDLSDFEMYSLACKSSMLIPVEKERSTLASCPSCPGSGMQPLNDRISTMIRYYTAMGLQLLGLILTGEALLLYFGDMGALMKAASLGAGLFYAGWFIRPRESR